MQKNFPRTRFWFRALGRLAVAGAAVSLASMLLIAATGWRENVAHADAIVVLGTRVDPDGGVSVRLRARLDRALELYRAGYAPVIVVSGGLDEGGFDQALVMRDYLLARGVPGSAIVADSFGVDTFSTARNVREMSRNRGWKSVLVVSQYFHVPRIRLAFARFGMQPVYYAHADLLEVRDIYALFRETAAWTYYLIRPYSQ